MQQPWDSDVKVFFVKILNSIAYFLFWLIANATAGLYFQLGDPSKTKIVFCIIFYICMVASLFLLLRYLYRKWKN